MSNHPAGRLLPRPALVPVLAPLRPCLCGHPESLRGRVGHCVVPGCGCATYRSATAGPTVYAIVAEVVESLGLRVRNRRQALGLSQRGAASEIGINYATVSRLEYGRTVTSEVLGKVLHWLDEGGVA